MSDTFHSEIVAPAGAFAPRAAAVVLGLGALAGWAFVLATTAADPVPAPAVSVPVSAEPTDVETDGRETLVAAPGPEVSLVLRAGGTSYIQLASLEQLPPHDIPSLHEHEGVYAAIAEVAPDALPLEHRAWRGQRVTVDGMCDATVVGFAVVSRLVGDTGYAGIDAERWTTATVFANGTQVLAARLSGCTGTLARAADLPPVVRPVQAVVDPTVVAAARARLIASDASSAAQEEWTSYDGTGAWFDNNDTAFHTRVLAHPITGARFISVHGSLEGGCGMASANVWGLYRVDRGSLVTVEERTLGDMTRIDDLVDVDGDGNLELVGKDWIGLGTIVMRATGEELTRSGMQFFGCSC